MLHQDLEQMVVTYVPAMMCVLLLVMLRLVMRQDNSEYDVI